ncbi:MAG: hypothetical protein UR27_C0008G0004 [Candidatus Peregrinibacteria bacterium GW2011_GWA2_33_10]|nr:MAG: hypothetical protein UR27_C0008G0004 [Candidatus Peregrinibacteria bacterium GW2011_GWA2_33_10]
MVPVIVNDGVENQAILMKWGFIPHFMKDSKIGFSLINARGETVNTKPFFKFALRDQRCLVPTSGFYEWKRNGNQKIPYYIHLKNEPLFAFAGLYDVWEDENKKKIFSFTIITTEANKILKEIHDRMPVILNEEDELKWLSKDINEEVEVLPLLKSYSSEKLELYEVSAGVNNPRNNSVELIKKRE